MENKSKLSWEKFSPLFGTWNNKIKPFFFQGGLDEIFAKLKEDSARGKKIFPSSENVFRAFRECPINELKLVVCGISPYHSMKDEVIIADGLAMSCSNTNYLQPTLDHWYNACERELNRGLCLPCAKNPDLTFLAKSGVLLLNAGLTVEASKACSHNLLWEPFMKYLFTEIINNIGVPIVLLGKESHKLEKYINPFSTVFRLSHPTSVVYNSDNTEWDSQGMFSKVNEILKYGNNTSIQWFDESDIAPF